MHVEHSILHLGKILIKLKQKNKNPFHLIVDLNMTFESHTADF